jgi:hypothetical protein
MLKGLVGLLLATGIAPQCTPANESPERPPCEADVVYVHIDETLGCDISPPQILVVRIPLDRDYQLECDNRGGVISYVDAFEQKADCYDTDY